MTKFFIKVTKYDVSKRTIDVAFNLNSYLLLKNTLREVLYPGQKRLESTQKRRIKKILDVFTLIYVCTHSKVGDISTKDISNVVGIREITADNYIDILANTVDFISTNKTNKHSNTSLCNNTASYTVNFNNSVINDACNCAKGETNLMHFTKVSVELFKLLNDSEPSTAFPMQTVQHTTTKTPDAVLCYILYLFINENVTREDAINKYNLKAEDVDYTIAYFNEKKEVLAKASLLSDIIFGRNNGFNTALTPLTPPTPPTVNIDFAALEEAQEEESIKLNPNLSLYYARQKEEREKVLFPLFKLGLNTTEATEQYHAITGKPLTEPTTRKSYLDYMKQTLPENEYVELMKSIEKRGKAISDGMHKAKAAKSSGTILF